MESTGSRGTGSRGTGRLAVTVGVVAVGSAVLLGTYFAVRGPFGAINDVGNAAIGVLSATLAWKLRRHIAGRTGDLAVGAALVGAPITVVGSALVMSEATDFFLAGLVSSVGFAGIGAWLVALNRSGARADAGADAGADAEANAGDDAGADAWPRRLRSLGVVAGALMSLGIVSLPGVLLRLDDMATAPGWIWIGHLGWLGIYAAYPAWAIWLGTVELRQAREPTQPGQAVV